MKKRTARIIGIVYLLTFLTSMLSDHLLQGLVVQSDPTGTVSRLISVSLGQSKGRGFADK